MRPPTPDVGIDQRLDATVPLDLMFRAESGSERPLGDYLDGKPAILVLGYYRCPRLCSQLLNELTGALRRVDYEVGREFVVVTVSIDPRETPELAAAKKQAHVEAYGRPGAETGWRFLTGTELAIARLANAVGYRYRYDALRDDYAHAGGIIVLTPAGKVSRYFYGITYSPRDLRFGLEDASAGKIGSRVLQPLRLLCFAYDPASGTYTLAVLNLVRLGGLVTCLLLGTYIARSWLRERRRG